MFAASEIGKTIWNCWAEHMLVFFSKLWSVPLIKLKFYNGWHQPLKRKSFQLKNSNTNINSHETVPLKLFGKSRVLTKESFHGLYLLQSLHIHDLHDLKRFDADSLSSLTYLSSLHVQVIGTSWLNTCLNKGSILVLTWTEYLPQLGLNTCLNWGWMLVSAWAQYLSWYGLNTCFNLG